MQSGNLEPYQILQPVRAGAATKIEQNIGDLSERHNIPYYATRVAFAMVWIGR